MSRARAQARTLAGGPAGQRSCPGTGPTEPEGHAEPRDTCPRVWIEALWRGTHMQAHTEQPHLSSRYSQLEILSGAEETALGEGLVFVANGSLSAGGPLPAPCVHTCGISHQHLLSPPPPPGSTGLCVTVCPIGRVWQHRDKQMATLRPPRPPRHKDFEQHGRAG